MADIFSRLPGMRGLMAYWYHFAIMFEALFILTTIDAGTQSRALRAAGIRRPGLETVRHDPNWLPGSIVSTALICLALSYFIWTGNISTIWPMFGIANQLLASVALAVGTTILINMGRAKYAWVTFLPLCFVAHHHADGGIHERPRQLLADGHWTRIRRCTCRATSIPSARRS